MKTLKPRLYQETILNTCSTSNCLVVLPTGMGKTFVAYMLAMHMLKQFPKKKILFLAPTRPLVEQHKTTFDDYIIEDMAVFTGMIAPEKRKEMWEKTAIVFSTSQGLANDVREGRISLKDVSLMIFDEAHRAVGDYSYVYLASQADENTRILGLTASPGSEKEKIEEVCKNLKINAVEIRTENDPDMKPYIQEVDMRWVSVELPLKFKEIRMLLQDLFKSRINALSKHGYKARSKTDLLKLQSQLFAEDEKDYNCIFICAEAIKLQHALELLETQGLTPLCKYFDKLMGEASNASRRLVKEDRFKAALAKAQALHKQNIEHPKLEEMKRIVGKEKTIIFTQYRDTASKLKSELPGSRIFVGQAKKGGTGMSQKEQKAMLEEFDAGEFNVMICTSVAEEGLDIPSVDLVVFYEPIPSAIRHIQRRGRTGRLEKGKVVILVTKGTRDESYKWSAFHKEKRMYETLKNMKNRWTNPHFETVKP